MGSISDASIRDALLKLAQQIFPLENWIRDGAKYVPPDAADLPWRAAGQVLSIQSMCVIERFELLIDNDVGDENLRVRWNKIAAAPLWMELMLPHQPDWRSQHKLDDVAVFAPVDSDNFTIATDDPKTKVKKPRARAEFYRECWPLLKAAQAECLFPDNASWMDFTKNLLNDLLSAWPTTKSVKSSDFLKRYAKDIAICLLDMENSFFANTAEGDLWQRAVLIESGEHRFRHNAYNPEQVKAAVDHFDALLSSRL